MNDYINIHTHTIGNKNQVAIVNLFPENAEKTIAENPNALFSVGLHPWFIDTDAENQLRIVEKLSTHPQVFAIGEIGLDKLSKTPLETQIRIFKAQIQIAVKAQKPIIIHCVKAHQEILVIKKELQANVPFVFHGFRGKPALAKQVLKEDCYISVGKQAIQNPETLIIIPENRLLIETDENDIDIKTLYKIVAEIRKTTEEKLLKQVLENFNLLTKSKLSYS